MDTPQHRNRIRLAVRVLCLGLATSAMLPAIAGPGSLAVVPSSSPFVIAASLMATKTFRWTMILGLATALAAIVRRRWFCRYVCPTGLCADGVGLIGMRLGRRCPKVPSLGPWIVWTTLGGALLSHPIFLWLDPMAMFSGFFNIFSQSTGAAVWVASLALPAVLIASLLMPGVWCSRVCPLGSFQDSIYTAGRSAKTIFAKAATKRTNSVPDTKRLTRRGLLRFVSAGALGALWASGSQAMRTGPPTRIRPPGASIGPNFYGLCVRCGNCARVCPSRIIDFDLGDDGISAFMTPVVDFQDDYCREDCVRCMDACPSGALTSVPLNKKQQTKIGLPQIDMDVCLLGDDRECSICRNCCPFEAISLVFDEDSYTLSPAVDGQKCPGCGACEVACPTKPVKAIRVFPL